MPKSAEGNLKNLLLIMRSNFILRNSKNIIEIHQDSWICLWYTLTLNWNQIYI